MKLTLRSLDLRTAESFVQEHHYSSTMPQVTRLMLGGFDDNDRLLAVATLGLGTRPRHTIKILFPSLDTGDYLELGRLCLSDEAPRNSESQFLSHVVQYLRAEHPEIKVLFSWSDGIVGKPGYVYQASNFLYGGFIETTMYLDASGNRKHIRALQTLAGAPPTGDHEARKAAKKQVFRARGFDVVSKLGYTKYFGRQFRYVYPLCDNREWRRLQKESLFAWTRNYPKDEDCKWRVQVAIRKVVPCEKPFINLRGAVRAGVSEENSLASSQESRLQQTDPALTASTDSSP